MKWKPLAVIIMFVSFLGACSSLEDVNNTLSYANKATEYANEAQTFAQETPSLARQAVSDEQAAQELEVSLEQMKQNIEEFNELQPPEVGANLHQRVVEQNNQAIKGIDLYLTNIENGKLDPAVLDNREAFQTLQEISGIVSQIKQLGG